MTTPSRIVSLWLLLTLATGIANADPVTPEVIKEVRDGCLKGMGTKVVSQQFANAYCYCYSESMVDYFTQQDFERMGVQGPSENDQNRFKKARKRCKPSKKGAN